MTTSKALKLDQVRIMRDGWGQIWNLSLPMGGWTALVGPSGAGKSTLLDAIAGLLPLQSGRVIFDEIEMSSKPPSQRRVSYLFQESSLFPSLTVYQNLFLAMHDVRMSKSDKRQRIASILSDFQIEDKAAAYPVNLSGGEKARVELARSFIRESRVLLLDEPFSSLDTVLRRHLLMVLKDIQKKRQMTVICVSHNPEDTFLVADHLMVMDKGHILASDSLGKLMCDPVSEKLVGILGLGCLLIQPDGSWFVPFGSLHQHDPSLDDDLKLRAKEDLQGGNINSLNKVRTFSLKKFHKVPTPLGFAVLDLESGNLYPLKEDRPFHGVYYFLESDAKRL